MKSKTTTCACSTNPGEKCPCLWDLAGSDSNPWFFLQMSRARKMLQLPSWNYSTGFFLCPNDFSSICQTCFLSVMIAFAALWTSVSISKKWREEDTFKIYCKFNKFTVKKSVKKSFRSMWYLYFLYQWMHGSHSCLNPLSKLHIK